MRFGRHCESLPIGVLIAEGSPDFRCAYANRVLRRLIEPRALPIEGRPLAEVLEMAEKAVLETLRQADSELLTTREWEVAGLVAQGLANKAIAHRLYLSRATIASHVAKILHKLGFDSRVQIAAWVVQRRMTSRSF